MTSVLNILANVIAFGIAVTIFIGFPVMAYQVWKEYR
jgi:Sec-independent protein secretion pathway component TatC